MAHDKKPSTKKGPSIRSLKKKGKRTVKESDGSVTKYSSSGNRIHKVNTHSKDGWSSTSINYVDVPDDAKVTLKKKKSHVARKTNGIKVTSRKPVSSTASAKKKSGKKSGHITIAKPAKQKKVKVHKRTNTNKKIKGYDKKGMIRLSR